MVRGSRLTTAEELARLPTGSWRYELVKGELRRMSPAGHEHGRVAAELLISIGSFVKARALGATFAAETGFLLQRDPDTVRAPDVGFVRAVRLTAIPPAGDGYFPGPPDLAIEVVSPSDKYTDVETKITDWLAAGCQAVVVLDPRRRLATVHRQDDLVVSLGPADVLAVADVLPGWSIGLAEIFTPHVSG